MSSLRFTLEAGALVRSAAVRELRAYCWRAGIECRIEEDRGWLSSGFRVELTGPDSALQDARRDVMRWASQNPAGGGAGASRSPKPR